MTKTISESSATILSASNEEKPVKVLHVDDDLCFAKVTKRCLEMQGKFQVETASSVDEAIEKMKEQKYDAIVSDYQMPGKDGLQFLEELREKSDNIPFIIFTGKSREEVAVKALNLGADHYLSKNGDPEIVYSELSHDIANMVRTRRAEQELGVQREELQKILDSLPSQIWYKDKNNRLVRVNKRFAEYMGVSKKDLEGKPLGDLFPPDVAQKCWDEDKEVIETGQPKIDILDRHESAQGLRWFLTSKVPYKDADGKIIGTINFSSDITERKAAEVSVTDRALLEFLVESSDDAIIGKTLDGIIVSWNSGAKKIYGYAPEEVIGKSVSILIPPEIQDDVSKILDRIKRGEHVDRYYTKRLKKDQSRIDVSITVSPIKDAKGKIIGASTIARDITERRKIEQQIKKTVEELNGIFSAITDLMFTIDMDNAIVKVNKNFCDFVKKKPEELIGKHCYEIMHGIDKPWRDCPHRKTLETKQAASAEINDPHLGIPLLVTVSPIYDEKGEFVQCVHTAKDITERKKAEEQLRDSEKKYRELFETSIDAIATSDMSGHFVGCNQSCLKMLGYTLGEMRKLTYQQLTPKKWREKEAEIIEKEVMQKGYTAEYEKELIRKDGTVIPVSNRVWATFDENGKPKAMWGIVRDITERKKTEQTLRASLERYRSFIEVTGELGWTTNPEGEVVEDIPSFRRFTGQNCEEVKGWGWSKALHPDDFERTTNVWKEATRTKSKYETEYRMRRHDGVYRYLMARGVPVLEENRSIREWVGTCIDITERKKAETLVLESQQRFQSLFSNNPEATIYIDVDFTVVDINQRFTTLFGYFANEVKGKNINDLIVPKDHVEEAEMLDKKAVEGYAQRDTVRMRKDKSPVSVSISAAPVIVRGQLKGYVGVYKDISQLKKAEEELRETMAKLQVMNEKLRVVGSLTRHDARNKLTAVTGNAYLARKKLPENSEVLQYIAQIEASAEQTVRVLDFVKTYEMLGVEQLNFVDVEKTVNEAISLFSGLNEVKVTNDCQGLTVLADSLLRQLFYNLVDDSLKYGKKLSWIRIHCEEKSDHLNIIYEDDGVGIPASEKPKLFSQGYSTGGSTGYGLYLIKKMTEVYGWTIKEDGEAGRGAVFVMTIPKTHESRRINYKLH